MLPVAPPIYSKSVSDGDGMRGKLTHQSYRTMALSDKVEQGEEREKVADVQAVCARIHARVHCPFSLVEVLSQRVGRRRLLQQRPRCEQVYHIRAFALPRFFLNEPLDRSREAPCGISQNHEAVCSKLGLGQSSRGRGKNKGRCSSVWSEREMPREPLFQSSSRHFAVLCDSRHRALVPTMQTAKEQPGSGASSGASSTPNPQQGGSSSTANNSNNNSNNSAANSGGVGPAMGGSLAGVDLGPSMLAAAGPAATSGPSIPAGTGPGGTPTTALSVYHLITQLCQRPDPASIISANKQGAQFSGQGQGPATGATGAEALAGSSTQRETALLELSKKREQYEDLALVLWHSFGELLPLSPNRTPKLVLTAFSQPGVMSSLLQEIISVYPMLTPSSLSAHASNRVCNALALLQCVASHPETRVLFLNGSSLQHSLQDF